MNNKTKDIPFIKEIMKLRMAIKATPELSTSLVDAIHATCKDHGIDISHDAIKQLIFVHPEEIVTTQSVPNLPVGSQCQAW